MLAQIWGFACRCHIRADVSTSSGNSQSVLSDPTTNLVKRFIDRDSCLKPITAVSETPAVHSNALRRAGHGCV